RAAAPVVQVWAAQHAGYSSDKTFGTLDPVKELNGHPDGCAMPAPDGIFVMGDLARGFWRRNALPEERVLVTGGLRYESVRIEERQRRGRGRDFSALLVASMSESADLATCAAAVAAI